MARKSWIRSGLVVLFCLSVALSAFAGGGAETGSKGFVVGTEQRPLHSQLARADDRKPAGEG